jgi:glyceraldehyde-3-phosphate dehydrogenase (NADP+)
MEGKMREYGRFIQGEFENAGDWLEVTDKESGEPFARVRTSGVEELERAIGGAVAAFPQLSSMPASGRADLIDRLGDVLERRQDELADMIRREAGKPLLLAKIEAARAVDVARMTAIAAREVLGEYRDMDGYAQGRGVVNITRRFPLGPVAAISPFNFPLNLVMHKVAPAIAAGCPVVHKPARSTPVSPLLLAECLVEAGLPAGCYQVLVSEPEVAEGMVTDQRLKVLTFTGSAEVGWHLRSVAGRKKTVLELGGNAAVIVEPDADLKRTARQVAVGAYAFAGQVCISIQRIFVARAIYEEFKRELVAAIGEHARVGKTSEKAVIVGPLITAGDADRVEAWVAEALHEGAVSLTGELKREGNAIHPVLLENVDDTSKVSCQEVFGPVAFVAPYDSFEEACERVNDSEFGLQAGVITNDIHKALYAFEHLEVGGVILGDGPTKRVDHQPYGGTKMSGEGREGPRFALEHFTEERVLFIQR